MRARHCLLFLALPFTAVPPCAAWDLVLPTDNKALLEGRPEDFYQFVDRTEANGEKTMPWEGGQFGFVRNPTHLNTGETIYTRFHEVLDIKPVHRDARDEPADEVRSMAAGDVAYISPVAGHSNYGKYVVVHHDWGEGPFYSLYAHLNEIRCAVGQKVEPGTVLAIMGHTGAGIDRRRAHVHTELNLFLSSHFAELHDGNPASPNYHGNWNGMNLIGVNLAEVYQAHAKDKNLSVSKLVQKTEPYFRVAVPGTAEMEIVKNYPWLCPGTAPATPPASWQVTFSAWGLPLKAEPGTEVAEEPRVVWVKNSTSPHFSLCRGLLNGKGETARLSGEGDSYVRLACGLVSLKMARKPTEEGDNKMPARKRTAKG